MTAMLVAFEPPAPDESGDVPVAKLEEAWDQWIASLREHHLALVNDLDPVAVVGHIEVYEAEKA